MSNVVVVDASIALKWTINETDSSTALALLADWTDREIEVHAPSLLVYEVTNALYRRVRKGEIPFDDARRGLTEIIFKVVEFDFPEDPDFNIRAMELGQQFGLPAAYDFTTWLSLKAENVNYGQPIHVCGIVQEES